MHILRTLYLRIPNTGTKIEGSIRIISAVTGEYQQDQSATALPTGVPNFHNPFPKYDIYQRRLDLRTTAATSCAPTNYSLICVNWIDSQDHPAPAPTNSLRRSSRRSMSLQKRISSNSKPSVGHSSVCWLDYFGNARNAQISTVSMLNGVSSQPFSFTPWSPVEVFRVFLKISSFQVILLIFIVDAIFVVTAWERKRKKKWLGH